MNKKGKHIKVFIRRSCITGKVIWVYRGVKTGEYLAYWRACRKELQRFKMWAERLDRRRRNMTRLLSDSSSRIPITEEMTPEQREAARQLHELSVADVKPDREFYDHIIEERRRREEDREIRRQMREREALERESREQDNRNYDK